MSVVEAYSNVVLFGLCRSNHHRIAIDALSQIQAPGAPLWRALFLKHYAAVLEGAKAPDERFKDFKNHVLHVKDNYWGGAPDAAAEWYRRTVRALAAKDWALAAYNAGVMSHYVVDPVQPFHTGQTETENVIHRAVEQSFSKSYKALRAILLTDLGGYPQAPSPDGPQSGPDWVRAMVRAGAERSNPFYGTVIDHYDFAAGVKNPPAGLDQELKDVIAGLIGFATSLLARVLDGAIVEAGVEPPRVDLTLDMVFTTATVPVKALIAALDDVKERGFVTAQYEEFVKTGKVRATLSDDDLAVRALHAAEVAKVPLSTLDCEWPGEIGLAHGSGATPRKVRKPGKAGRAPAPMPVTVAPAEAAARPAPVMVQPTTLPPPPAKAEAASAPPAPPPEFAPAEEAVLTAPEPAAQAAPAAAETRPAPRLAREADVVDAPSIGPKTAERFYKAGLRTVADLLDAAPDEVARRLETRHISAQVVRDWQAQALLACTVPGLTGTAAQLFVACGVRDAEALAGADANAMHEKMRAFAATSDGQSVLRSGRPPGIDQIRIWIDNARSVARRAAA